MYKECMSKNELFTNTILVILFSEMPVFILRYVKNNVVKQYHHFYTIFFVTHEFLYLLLCSLDSPVSGFETCILSSYHCFLANIVLETVCCQII